MKKLIKSLMFKLAFILYPTFTMAQSDTVIRLNSEEMFTLIEYRKTEYESVYGADNTKLPTDYSFLNYYVDINGDANAKNIEDINYLFLNGYSNSTVDSGYLYYLVPVKNRPMSVRKTNIRSSKTVDRFYDITSVADMVFGYWKRSKDKQRLFIIFRESTGIEDMSQLRIFSGLVVNQNIYMTHAMNTKDDYLFDLKFKINKEINVKLPVELESVFYATEVTNYEDASILKLGLTRDESMQKIKATIKYWSYDKSQRELAEKGLDIFTFDSLNFQFIKSGKCSGKKSVLFTAWKSGVPAFHKIKLSNYFKYFNGNDFNENIFVNVEDPYLKQLQLPCKNNTHTFYLPYYKKTFIRKVKSILMKLA